MRSKLAAALAAAVCAAPAAGADQIYEYVADEQIPLPESGIAAVSIQVGPVLITEVRVRNMPSSKDLRDNMNGLDRSRPKPTVTAKSDASEGLEVFLSASLEDASGEPYLSCKRKVELAAGATDDWGLCSMEGMYTKDWPRLKVFHVVARVKLEDPVPGTAAEAAKGLGDGHAVVIHYHRSGSASGWGLHIWEILPEGQGRAVAFVTWPTPLPPTGEDDFGVYWAFKDTSFRDGRVNYIIHRGDNKEQCGDDKSFLLAKAREAWVNARDCTTYFSKEEALAAQGN